MKKYRTRILAAALLPAFLGGCAQAEDLMDKLARLVPEVVPGQTISKDSKWINSDLDGAVNEQVTVSEKDDFHTAVNREWLLNTKVDDSKGEVQTFTATQDTLDEQNRALLTPANIAVDENILSQEDYEHLEEVVSSLTGLLGDWETRDGRGAQPIRSYVEAIESAKTLEDLSSWLCAGESGAQEVMDLMNFSVSMNEDNRDQYSVILRPGSSWLLMDQNAYIALDSTSVLLKGYNEEGAFHVLGQLGYTEQEIRNILRKAYLLESRLAGAQVSTQTKGGESYEGENITIDGIRELQGNYPLAELLERYGLAESTSFTLYDPDYLTALGRIYSEKRLDELKSYFILQTVIDSLPYLDRECYELYEKREQAYQESQSGTQTEENTPEEPFPDETGKNTEERKTGTASAQKDQKMLQDFTEGLLPEVLDELYVARYCTAADKEYLQDMTQDMLEYYRGMLLSEEWLSEETRQKAAEKLDALTVRILYPDHLTDYSGLFLDAEGTLPDAIEAVTRFYLEQQKQKVNQPLDRSEWAFSTRIVNAYYYPMDNSINILAGFLADGSVYRADASYEENLGRIGMVIGHEITHAFDTSGYQFDKDGRQESWWTPEDEEAFRIRASKVAKYYSALSPIPGASYNGEAVQGEAIADMGGLKCALAVGSSKESFDKAAFFRAYADLWKAKRSYRMELARIGGDEHPVGFLRTNVTVQQFDEFLDTFDIQKTDGMYLDPKDRILVW